MAALVVRKMRKGDLHFVRYLYLRRGRPAPDEISRHGCVVENGTKAIFAAQLQMNDGPHATIFAVVGDPSISREERAEAHVAAFSYLEEVAKSMGYLGLATAANIGSLTERYERLGFHVVEENLTLYVKEF